MGRILARKEDRDFDNATEEDVQPTFEHDYGPSPVNRVSVSCLKFKLALQL